MMYLIEQNYIDSTTTTTSFPGSSPSCPLEREKDLSLARARSRGREGEDPGNEVATTIIYFCKTAFTVSGSGRAHA